MGWIFIQAALSLVAFHLLVRVILPGLARVPDRGHLLEAWIPVALVVPMICFGAFAGGGAAAKGWVAVGGPVMTGIFAVGAALLTAGPLSDELHLAGRSASAWLGTGLLLILLASAHDLTSWIGQSAFAIGAVLLWMNTPDVLEPGGANDAGHRIGWSMLAVLGCSAGAATAAVLAGAEHAAISGGLAITVAAMSVAAAARLGGAAAALRLGAWCSVYGVLFGLGVMSLSELVPEAVRLLRDGEMDVVRRVAYGFGVYAFDAVVLLVLPLIPLATRRLGWGWRRAAGVLLLLAAAVLSAARLAALSA